MKNTVITLQYCEKLLHLLAACFVRERHEESYSANSNLRDRARLQSVMVRTRRSRHYSFNCPVRKTDEIS